MSDSADTWTRLNALRDGGHVPHPARSRRTHTVLEVLKGLAEPAVDDAVGPACGLPVGHSHPQLIVAGRLYGTPAAPQLVDATGRLSLPGVTSLPTDLQPGDWVEVALTLDGGDLQVVATHLLAPALAPPLPAPPEADRPFDSICPGGGASISTLRRRAQLLHGLRIFFQGRGFLEVETPALTTRPGLEPHLDPFETRYRAYPQAQGRPAWLLTSPEYAMKRLLVAGVERCFQVSRVFRNGECGPMHNPEFTMVEWYRTHASYLDIMVDCEDLILSLAANLGLGLGLSWQGQAIDLSPPWERLTVEDALRRYAGVEMNDILDLEGVHRAAQALGLHLPEDCPWDDAFFHILMEKVEPRLGFTKPTFLMDYPAPLAALAKLKGDDARVAERFELYVAGQELGNAFSELSCPQEQSQRFESEREHRAAIGSPIFEVDPDYLLALRQGLPPTGGIAVGVDRLAMILLDIPDVRRVLAFPFDGAMPE